MDYLTNSLFSDDNTNHHPSQNTQSLTQNQIIDKIIDNQDNKSTPNLDNLTNKNSSINDKLKTNDGVLFVSSLNELKNKLKPNE